MRRGALVIGYRLAFAALSIVAMVTQFVYLLTHRGSPLNFFSFFTIESNIFAAAMLIYGALRRPEPSYEYDMLRGAATTYMTITGVVYVALLSNLPPGVDSTIGWVNWVLHRIMPVVLFLDWVLVPPAHELRFRKALWWAVFPLVYAGYSLIRGAVVHWYPYPFLNVDSHGYARVTVTCLAVAVGALAFIWVVVWLGNMMRPESRLAAGSRRPSAG
jgi:hypothetical protein